LLTPFQIRARDALFENAFFRAFSDDCLRWVQRTAVRKGELLFEKGQPSSALFGLVSGQVKLFSMGADERQISFGLVGPGEMIGELGISKGSPRHTSAVALTHSEFATLSRHDLKPLLNHNPSLREALSEASAEMTRRLSERIEDTAFLTIEARVEKTVFDIARRFGERTEDSATRVQLRPQDLADEAGLNCETVSKVLSSSSMRDRVEVGHGRIVLLDD
jgi:CRP/FNR family cyclic AMP-dependent transcriptional regulator